MSGKLKGTVYVLICVALWALIPVVSKMGQTTLDNHQFLFWSSLVSFLVLGAACFALFSVLSKNIKNEPLGVVTIYFLTATFASFLSMNYFSDFALPSGSEIVPVLVNGIMVNGFSYLF
ncbi:MAG: hypothetical protein DRP58_05560 [Spirochaetes bacterium]|nr:MAG: hypothetical protein DRP58_05560 [Spirochaetota bacterium]